jgi:hypothetical protein
MSKIIIEVNESVDVRDKQELNNILNADAKVWASTLSAIRKANGDDKQSPIKTSITFGAELDEQGNHLSTQLKAFSRKFSDGRTVKTTPPKSGSKKSR